MADCDCDKSEKSKYVWPDKEDETGEKILEQQDSLFDNISKFYESELNKDTMEGHDLLLTDLVEEEEEFINELRDIIGRNPEESSSSEDEIPGESSSSEDDEESPKEVEESPKEVEESPKKAEVSSIIYSDDIIQKRKYIMEKIEELKK